MIIDLGLVERLEASGAALSQAVGRALRVLDADDISRVRELGRGALLAYGPGRYVNRAVGVSLHEPDDAGLDEVESFFGDAGVAPSIEVCSWVSGGFLRRLALRGYVAEWFRNVFVGEPRAGGSEVRSMAMRRVGDDLGEWQRVRVAGFGLESAEAQDVDASHSAASHAVVGTVDIVADLDGEPAACATIQPFDAVAWLGGAATVPAFRGRGAQSALLAHRIELAGELGCDLVAATALPAGGSARNLARAGFQLAYAQVVMTQPPRDGLMGLRG